QVHYNLGYDYRSMQYSGTNNGLGNDSRDVLWDLGQPGHDNWWICFGVDTDEYYSWQNFAWHADGTGTGVNGGGRGAGICGDQSDPGPPFTFVAANTWPGESSGIQGQRPQVIPSTAVV